MGPLSDIKVVELAGLGPAPFCGMLLADMGADVVRVDRVVAGDLGIAFPVDYDLRNRNKRSVALDLKAPEGLASCLRLIAQADVLIEGFRPGVAERLGLGPDAAMEKNPALVYGRGTGWGQDGPLAQAAGHDINYIAITGALNAIGPADGPPVPPLNLIGDYGGGALYLAFGILCALNEARRSGHGQVVDAAMVDGVTSLMTVFHALRQTGGYDGVRGHNTLDGGAPYYGVYETADGKYMAVGAIEGRFYAKLLEGLEIDPESLPAQNDRSGWPEIKRRLAARFLEKTRVEWCAIFDGGDACVSPVLAIDEVAGYPHNAERGMFVDHDGVSHPRPAPRLSATPGEVKRRSPHPGEHSREVLAAWGFAAEDVERGEREGWCKQSD